MNAIKQCFEVKNTADKEKECFSLIPVKRKTPRD